MTSLTAQPARAELADPAFQAFTLLRVGFTAAPILFGLDKFFEVMTDWSTYLWPGVASALPGSADTIMFAVGIIEIVAGVLVALRPRIGGLVVNLLLIGDYYDIALRDFGLLLGALSLARLASAFAPTGERTTSIR